MATHTDIHDTTDAKVAFTHPDKPLSGWITLTTRNNDSVTLYLPRDPRERHKLITKLRFALDAADEDALAEIVNGNLDTMTDAMLNDIVAKVPAPDSTSLYGTDRCPIHGTTCRKVWHNKTVTTTSSLRIQDICARSGCGHNRYVHNIDMGDAHPCNVKGITNCVCYDFIPSEIRVGGPQ